MRVHLAPRRLFGRVGLVIAGVALVQFAATLLLYDHISRDMVREDQARRVAELLEVSQRLYVRDEDELAAIMSTKHLQVWLTDAPAVTETAPGAATRIRDGVRRWEPTLAEAPLTMDLEKRARREHLIGSMGLDDGRWLNFRSMDLSQPWPIIASATLIALLLALLCIGVAAFALWQLGAPLRRLTEATNRIGEGRQVILDETGPSDVRNLSRAFNAMQARIAQILKDQTSVLIGLSRAFNAMQARIAQILKDQTSVLIGLSHDLRTPLSRLKMATDYVEPEDMRALVGDNVGEMEALIVSLQNFLNAHQLADEARSLDLGEIVGEAAAAWPDRVETAPGLAGVRIISYPTVLRRALTPLIENAVQYGGRAFVSIARDDRGEVEILIEDAGPGIAEEHIPQLIQPFFRIDPARARDTGGFGLGIPTAQRLLQRFGGGLEFGPSERGGLRVRVRPPRPLDEAPPVLTPVKQ